MVDFAKTKRSDGIKMKVMRSLLTRMILFVGIGLFTLAFWGCGDRAETDVDAQPQTKKIKRVNVSPVEATEPKGSIEYVGMLTARRKANVASETGGTIEALYFEKGDRVKEGQLLAEISTTSIRLEVNMASATLKEAEAALSEAEKNYKRVKDLYEISAVSDSKFDAANRSAKMARANMEKAAASLTLAEDRLRKSRLHAPHPGIIVFRDVEQGEVVPSGTTITQVIDLQRLILNLSLSENDIHILEKHKHFDFTIDAIAGETFSCGLSFLSPAANPVTRAFPVELMVDEPDPRMADGMTVRVKLPMVDERKAIKVPSSWISEENGRIGLYVVEEGKAAFRPVTLGAYYDQRVEILSGLSDEELVITNPAGIKSGEPVEH